MRKTDSGGKTELTTSLSSRALFRSWPNGFSMTTRRHSSGEWLDSPDRLSWLQTTGKAPGGIEK